MFSVTNFFKNAFKNGRKIAIFCRDFLPFVNFRKRSLFWVKYSKSWQHCHSWHKAWIKVIFAFFSFFNEILMSWNMIGWVLRCIFLTYWTRNSWNCKSRGQNYVHVHCYFNFVIIGDLYVTKSMHGKKLQLVAIPLFFDWPKLTKRCTYIILFWRKIIQLRQSSSFIPLQINVTFLCQNKKAAKAILNDRIM